MFPHQFLSMEFYQKKKDIVLYRAHDPARHYMLKSIIPKDDADRQAFYDEYETLSGLVSSSLPIYYGICEDYTYPDRPGSYLTLCMEDCSTGSSLEEGNFTLSEFLQILYQIGTTLHYLLEKGVLYTDLHPSNVLIHKEEEELKITLLDFTYCYYYKRNPHPSYPLRFSYNLDPSLKGHQLLIQELALLLQDVIQSYEDVQIPSQIYLLMETGLHPSETLLLPDYLYLIKKTII